MKIFKLFLTGLILLSQASCQKKSDERKEEEPFGRKKDWLYVNFSVEPPTYDFRKTSCRTTSVIAEMLYEGLMIVGRDGSIQPGQAESVEISQDGLHYTFHLRDTCWSDGVPVSAQEFAFSWLGTLDPNFPSVYAHLFYCIKNAQAAKEGRCPLSAVGIGVKDEKTLWVELEQPTSYFLCLTTSAYYFPIRLPKEETKGHLVEGGLVGNGPFKLQTWQPADEICVVKNPRYRLAKDIALQGINISLISDEHTAAELFENGDFDLLGMPFSPIPGDLAIALADKGKISSMPVGCVTVCCFNTRRFPFHNAKLRRAFSLAIDRKQLIDVMYPSAYAPAYTLVPSVFLQGSAGEHSSINRAVNIEKARRYFDEGLAELGLDRSQFPKLQLAYHLTKSHTLFQRLAEVMQQDWQYVLGVKIELQGLEIQSVIQRMVSKDFDSALITWSANYQDPMCFLDKFLTVDNPKNYPGWSHPLYNEAIIKANVSLDMGQRMGYLRQAESIFDEEAPCAPLFHWSYPVISHPRVQGLNISPAASIDYTSLRIDPSKQ